MPDAATALSQNASFWSAIAQIIPVLALAITLESRVIARRFSQKKSRASRSALIGMTLWMLATWLLLLIAFGSALGGIAPQGLKPAHLSSDLSQASQAVSWVPVATAMVAVLNGLLFAAYFPAAKIMAPGLRLIRMELVFWWPWSAVVRLRRDITKGRDSLRATVDELLAIRLRALAAAAEILVSDGVRRRRIRELEALPRELLLSTFTSPSGFDSEITLAAELESWKSADANAEYVFYVADALRPVEEIDALLAQARDQIAVEESYLLRINALRTGDNKRFHKMLRRIYEDAGKD